MVSCTIALSIIFVNMYCVFPLLLLLIGSIVLLLCCLHVFVAFSCFKLLIGVFVASIFVCLYVMRPCLSVFGY